MSDLAAGIVEALDAAAEALQAARVAASTFVEEEHPRGERGKFTFKEVQDAVAAVPTQTTQGPVIDTGERTGLWHLTDDPNFRPDPHAKPEWNSLAGDLMGDARPEGLFVGDPEYWMHAYQYERPFVAEIVGDVTDPPGTVMHQGREHFVQGDDMHTARVLTIDEYAREHYNEPGWVEEYHDPGPSWGPGSLRDRLNIGPDYKARTTADMTQAELADYEQRFNEYAHRPGGPLTAAAFDESLHPRDRGRFTFKEDRTAGWTDDTRELVPRSQADRRARYAADAEVRVRLQAAYPNAKIEGEWVGWLDHVRDEKEWLDSENLDPESPEYQVEMAAIGATADRITGLYDGLEQVAGQFPDLAATVTNLEMVGPQTVGGGDAETLFSPNVLRQQFSMSSLLRTDSPSNFTIPGKEASGENDMSRWSFGIALHEFGHILDYHAAEVEHGAKFDAGDFISSKFNQSNAPVMLAAWEKDYPDHFNVGASNLSAYAMAEPAEYAAEVFALSRLDPSALDDDARQVVEWLEQRAAVQVGDRMPVAASTGPATDSDGTPGIRVVDILTGDCVPVRWALRMTTPITAAISGMGEIIREIPDKFITEDEPTAEAQRAYVPWDPEEHPRGEGGRFVTVGDGEDLPVGHSKAAPGEFDTLVADLREEAAILADRAARVEPTVSATLQSIVPTGAELVGFDFRLKGENRMAEKLAEKHRQGLDDDVAIGQIADALRYTVTDDPEDYTGTYRQVTDGLRQAGFELVPGKEKNFWDRGDAYSGINTQWVTGDGQKFELQFHTPESFQVKEAIHDDYDTFRSSTDHELRAELWDRMVNEWEDVPIPPEVFEIGTRIKETFTAAAASEQIRYFKIDDGPVFRWRRNPDGLWLEVLDPDGTWRDEPSLIMYLAGEDDNFEEIHEPPLTASARRAYSPDQPRDTHGRFGEGTGGAVPVPSGLEGRVTHGEPSNTPEGALGDRETETPAEGPYFHGTTEVLAPGDPLEPSVMGHEVRTPEDRRGYMTSTEVYLTNRSNMAATYAARAARDGGDLHVYEIRPIGVVSPDPQFLAEGLGSDQVVTTMGEVVREVPWEEYADRRRAQRWEDLARVGSARRAYSPDQPREHGRFSKIEGGDAQTPATELTLDEKETLIGPWFDASYTQTPELQAYVEANAVPAPTLYRGTYWYEDHQEQYDAATAQLVDGQPHDLSLGGYAVAFSADRDIAQGFADQADLGMVFAIDGARGLAVADLADPAVHPEAVTEQEWLVPPSSSKVILDRWEQTDDYTRIFYGHAVPTTQAAIARRAYSPDQPRDERGRFGFGMGEPAVAGKSPIGDLSGALDRWVSGGASGDLSAAARFIALKGMTEDEWVAREGKQSARQEYQDARTLIDAIPDAPRVSEMYRGILNQGDVVGGAPRDPFPLDVGATYREPLASWSTDRGLADTFQTGESSGGASSRPESAVTLTVKDAPGIPAPQVSPDERVSGGTYRVLSVTPTGSVDVESKYNAASVGKPGRFYPDTERDGHTYYTGVPAYDVEVAWSPTVAASARRAYTFDESAHPREHGRFTFKDKADSDPLQQMRDQLRLREGEAPDRPASAAMAARAWQGSTDLTDRIQADADSLLTTGHDTGDAAITGMAAALMQGIEESPLTSVALYRGINIPYDGTGTSGTYTPGQEVEFALGSFTERESWAAKFGSGLTVDDLGSPVLFEIAAGDTQALDLGWFSRRKEADTEWINEEEEWVTGGKFEVVAVEPWTAPQDEFYRPGSPEGSRVTLRQTEVVHAP